MHLRSILSASVVVTLGLAFFVACGGQQAQQTVGGATTPPPAGGANAWCEAYCKKTSECWAQIPNENPSEPAAQVLAECRAKTNGCQVSQETDIMCCSTQADCTNFAACAMAAKNAPTTCH